MEPTLLRLGSRVELRGSAGWTPAVVDGALAPGRVRLLPRDAGLARGEALELALERRRRFPQLREAPRATW